MRIGFFLAAVLAAMLPGAVLAHHGNVMNPLLYFADELVELEGEVTEVLWRNPHTRLRMNVMGDDGVETIWELELGPNPKRLEGWGISPEDFMGTVKVAGNVSRRKENSLGVIHTLLPDGREHVQSRNPVLRWSSRAVDDTAPEIDPELVAAAEASASGIFRVWNGRIGAPVPIEADLDEQALTDMGRELHAAYDPVADNPQLNCRHGMPDTMFDPVPMEISDEGDQIRIHVAQYNIQRVIRLNAELPGDTETGTPVGHSVGRWEGDELIVTTTHVSWPYFSGIGLPQSTEVRYLERFSAADDGQTLNYSITIDDPIMFTEPFAIDRFREAGPGIEIEPFDCVLEWER
ncbi:MAG: DUF6152 family protein [Gammaproteobacteria bacterium]